MTLDAEDMQSPKLHTASPGTKSTPLWDLPGFCSMFTYPECLWILVMITLLRMTQTDQQSGNNDAVQKGFGEKLH